MRIYAVTPLLAVLLWGCAAGTDSRREACSREWERIEYISDHLAVAVDGGRAYLVTADGDIVSANDDPDVLKAGAEAAYARFLDEEYGAWEEILERYEDLCNACIARQSSDELLARLHALRTCVQHAVGRMDPPQRERFEAIRARYESYRR